MRLTTMMIELDGTENKSKLGANAILAVSLAVAKAAAEESRLATLLQVCGRHKCKYIAYPVNEHIKWRRTC